MSIYPNEPNWPRKPIIDIGLVPASRYADALNEGEIQYKKQAIAGLLARIEVEKITGVQLIFFTHETEFSSLMQSVYTIFGGEKTFETKIQHPSWQQEIHTRKTELLQSVQKITQSTSKENSGTFFPNVNNTSFLKETQTSPPGTWKTELIGNKESRKPEDPQSQSSTPSPKTSPVHFDTIGKKWIAPTTLLGLLLISSLFAYNFLKTEEKNISIPPQPNITQPIQKPTIPQVAMIEEQPKPSEKLAPPEPITTKPIPHSLPEPTTAKALPPPQQQTNPEPATAKALPPPQQQTNPEPLAAETLPPPQQQTNLESPALLPSVDAPPPKCAQNRRAHT
ncbi:MAG: hypothetical protein H7832_13390 [Magnetococcus sp. DMHC-6]